MQGRERIAVTGIGVVSALGQGIEGTWQGLIEGKRGIEPVRLFDVRGLPCQVAAEVGLSVRDVAPADQAEEWSRSDALALVAAREALGAAALPAGPISLVIGGTTGGMFEAEAVLSSLQQAPAAEAAVRRLLSYPLSTTGERLAATLGNVERVATVCSACSSSANAIVQGAAWIEQGRARAVLAGGTDGLCSLTFTGFNALGALDPTACRPFDAARSGLSLGEAAAFVLLEPESAARARGASIYGWLSGWAIAAEAHHITHPEPSGETAARLLEAAIRRAGLGVGDIDYVNAHGTATRHNDVMEWNALHRAFGDELRGVYVSSCKGQLGHTLGAAGALEAAMTLLALNRKVLPPTGGLGTPDPELPLNHILGQGQPFAARAALSSSFGFGGTGCVLCFEALDAPDRRPAAAACTPTVITSACSIGPLGVLTELDNIAYAEPVRSEPPDSVPDFVLDPARSRRFDRAARLVTGGAEQALNSASLSASGVGLVAGSAFGNVERSVEFLRRVAERGPRFANPAEFPHLVPSAAAGNASIYLGLTGPVVTVSDLRTSGEQALGVAIDLIALGLADAMIAGAAEAMDAVVAKVLSPLCTGGSPDRGEGGAWMVLEARSAARRRGARVLAEVRYHDHSWLGAPARLIQHCERPRQRAGVLVAAERIEVPEVLGDSSWNDVPLIDLSDRAGRHEAAGAVALCVGAALIAAGRLDHALVLGKSPGRVYVTELVRPSTDGDTESA